MENKGKLRVKFNLFDAVIIVLVLAVLAAALMLRNRSAGAAAAGHETQTMRFTVEMTEVPHSMADCIHIGDGAYRSTDGVYLGTIVDVQSVPHARIEYSSGAKQFIAYAAEESDDVYVTIENEGYCTDRDIIIGTLPIRVGAELPIKGKGFARFCYVYGLDLMGAEVPADTSAQTGDLEAEFVICFTDSRQVARDSIHVGDRFYDRRLGAVIGEVQSVESVPYGETRPTADGTAVYAEKPGRSNILVTLKGKCIERNDGYYLDGTTELKVGGTVEIQSTYAENDGVYYALLSVGK